MRLPLSARLAARELRGGVGAFRIFLLCLALGVAAIAAVGTVRSAIETGLQDQGAVLLGGDVEIEFDFRDANDEELAWIDGIATEISRVVDFRSMAVAGGDETSDRGLTQVKAVDQAYPLEGSVGLEPQIPLAEALDGEGGIPGAVMQNVLIQRLGLSVGDTFRLGGAQFRLMAELTSEPDPASAGFALGPRTIVRSAALEGSGLLGQGTIYEVKYRLDMPEDADLAALRAEFEERFGGSAAQWTDRRNGAPGVQRFVERIGAFLILVGLAGLAVGGVGISASVRSYLAGKTGVIATLKTLGAARSTIFATYVIEIGVLTVVGIAAGLVIGAALPLAFAPIIAASLPVPVAFGIHPAPLAQAALYGALTAAVFTLWPLARTEQVRAATLFRDGGGAKGLPRRRYLAGTAGLALMLVGAAAGLSATPRLALWTAAGIIAALAVLALAALGLRWVAQRLARSRALRGRSGARLALAAIGGPGEESVSVILSLGLGLTVLAAVGQIDTNLRNAIEREIPDAAPSYFFVDIQPDQIDGFRERLADEPGVSRVDSAPMLRGVVSQINGRPAAEVAGDHWVVGGDRGITYSDAPGPNTNVTAGEWWPADYDGPPQISFAEEEAAELGLTLGDTITVDVLGRPITAEITSLRGVDFSTAGIGFVITMNPGAVEGAPHTWISTVYAEDGVEAQILRDLTNAYPNITAVSVGEAIDNIAGVLDGIAAATAWGAGITLLTGFIVLIGAAAAGERARVYEAAVLKTLGATRPRILGSFALRSALLGGAAGVIALTAGVIAGWAVMRFVMDVSFVVAWGSGLAIVLGGVVATLLAGLAFAWRPMAARPARILRAQE